MGGTSILRAAERQMRSDDLIVVSSSRRPKRGTVRSLLLSGDSTEADILAD
jgi:hypothetical protein